MFYKNKSCCVPQKFKIKYKTMSYAELKQTVHYGYSLHIHSSSCTVSVQTLQSQIYVSICSCLSYSSSSQCLFDCYCTHINFCSYSFKVKIFVSMARNVIFMWLWKPHDIWRPEPKIFADTGQDNYKNLKTGTLLAKRR